MKGLSTSSTSCYFAHARNLSWNSTRVTPDSTWGPSGWSDKVFQRKKAVGPTTQMKSNSWGSKGGWDGGYNHHDTSGSIKPEKKHTKIRKPQSRLVFFKNRRIKPAYCPLKSIGSTPNSWKPPIRNTYRIQLQMRTIHEVIVPFLVNNIIQNSINSILPFMIAPKTQTTLTWFCRSSHRFQTPFSLLPNQTGPAATSPTLRSNGRSPSVDPCWLSAVAGWDGWHDKEEHPWIHPVSK